MKSLKDKHFWFVLLFLASFAAFLELGRMDVCTDNEGQRATPPAEMLRSGDFIVPTINGVTYLAKPPLLYWAIAGVYRATGEVSALTARIPTAACAVALILAVYVVFRARLGEHPARWAALGLLASPYFLERSRWAEIDVPLTLATFLAIAACWAAIESKRRFRGVWLTVGAGLAMGAAIMLKGPAPVLFLGAAWAAYLITRGDVGLKPMKRLAMLTALALLVQYLLKLTGMLAFPIALASVMAYTAVWAWRNAPTSRAKATGVAFATILIGVLLASPWALAVLNAQGWDSVRKLLSSEVITRTHTATDINSGSPLYYLVALPLLAAPWGFLFPFHASRHEWQTNGSNYRLCIVMAWLSILTFSLIAGKEYEYILPAFPFLLGATGVHLTNVLEKQSPNWMTAWTRHWGSALLVILSVLALAAPIYASVALRHPALIAETILLGAVALAAGAWAVRNRAWRVHGIALQALLVVVAGLLSVRSFYYTGANSPRKLAETAGGLLRAGYQVEVGWFRNPFTPAFAFYAAAPVPIQLNPTIVQERLNAETPYFFLVRERDLKNGQISLQPKAYQILMGPYTSKKYLMIGNASLPLLEHPPDHAPGG